jgi:hypothetical protein
MQNDMVDSPQPLGPADLKQVNSLLKFQVNRQKAERWAMRDMTFLIYDDTDAKTYGYDSDDEEGMLAHALQLSTEDETSGSQGSTGILSQLETGQSPVPSRSTSKERTRSECRICSDIPEFPHNRKPHKFRLFKPADKFPELLADSPKSVDVCMHYVAVSYCWPEPTRDDDGNIVKIEGTYKIRDLNDTVRCNRALDDVLDRAVDFANSCGLRMIWIDQECLPQPTEASPQKDKDYQQLGIQAMDIVYNRAIATAGLHAGEITSQEQLNAVKELIAVDKHKRIRPEYGAQFFSHVLDFLEMVSKDRWYTRAWVAQEALSAGSGLCLVFRRGSLISDQPHIRFVDKYGTPKHSLDTMTRSLPSEIVCIHVDDFRGLVRVATALLQQRFQLVGHALVRTESHSDTATILSTAGQLHPAVVKTNDGNVHMFGGSSYGQRRRVDGAGALSLLNSRGCRDCQDRIAIMANMCGYEIRLDTEQLAQHCTSLRVGLLALALLNGDLSILVPEVYSFPENDIGALDGTGFPETIGLTSPFGTHPERISYHRVQKGNLILPRVYKHAIRGPGGEGLRLSSYIWTVEDEIDLQLIKHQWAEEWQSLKCLRLIVDAHKGETRDHFLARRRSITHHFARADIMKKAKSEILRYGIVPPDSPVWAGLHPAGIQCTARLDASRVEAVPGMQLAVAKIFFGILRYLKSLSETDSRAIGAANSIWHSVRVDSVRADRRDLPDEVGDALFNHPDVIQNPFATLQLDVNRHGGYNQTWFIDRIMEHGTLWVGRYNRIPSSIVLSRKRTESAQSRTDTTSTNEMEIDSAGATEGEIARNNEAPSSRSTSGKAPAKSTDTILARQLQLQLFATLSSVTMSKSTDGDTHPSVNSGGMAYFAYLISRDVWTEEADQLRELELVSVFDVDGPCTVATPFNPDWEVLPHPDIRSMSVCWVIEAMQTTDNSSDKELEQVTEVPDAENEGEEGAGHSQKPSKASCGIEDGRLETERPVGENGPPKLVPHYRVMRKVRGMWQLMDLPMQEYAFL